MGEGSVYPGGVCVRDGGVVRLPVGVLIGDEKLFVLLYIPRGTENGSDYVHEGT